MTLVANCLTEEQGIQVAQTQQDGAEARYANGLDDAAFGRRPEYADDAYLAGYVAQLKQLPTHENGRIRHYSPRQHFAFGFMDGIDGEGDLAYV